KRHLRSEPRRRDGLVRPFAAHAEVECVRGQGFARARQARGAEGEVDISGADDADAGRSHGGTERKMASRADIVDGAASSCKRLPFRSWWRKMVTVFCHGGSMR